MKYRFLFGPVASRRLGLSMGIDLIKHKTCSFDCIYCECGATDCLTLERKEYIPTNEILDELEDYFKNEFHKNTPDCFTFSGSGEPTLALNIGKVIEFIKAKYQKSKVVVLTNSSLLWDPQVRKDIINADILSPSLDFALEKSYQEINRPDQHLKLNQIIEGLIKTRKEFKGKIWLEIFIVPDVNTSEKELAEFKKLILQIQPDKVHLNSLDRPGTVKDIPKASQILMNEIIKYWNLPNVDVIQGYQSVQKPLDHLEIDLKSRILETIKRRPSTLSDLAMITGASLNEVSRILHFLGEEKKIKTSLLERGTFYQILN